MFSFMQRTFEKNNLMKPDRFFNVMLLGLDGSRGKMKIDEVILAKMENKILMFCVKFKTEMLTA